MTDIVNASGVRSFGALPLSPPQWRSLDASLETLPERVKRADSGYVTGHIGKWHISPSNPIALGYDIGFDPLRAAGVGQEDPASVFAKTDAAKSFLDDRVANDEPFFLQLSHFAVHKPVEGQADVVAKYESLPKGTQHNDARYAAFTEALDTGVGQLLDHVDALGLRENTYIIYTTDNGARSIDSSSFPLTGTKSHLHEGGIRAPLVISGPGIEANSVSRVPVTTVDLYSTVSDLVGNTTPFQDGIEGASLRPLLENSGELPPGMDSLQRQWSEGGAIFFAQPHNHSVSRNYRIRPMHAVRQGDFKLLRIRGENGALDRDYLFNLSESYVETETNGPTDLAASDPAKTAELSRLLDNWLEAADVPMAYDVAKPVDMLWRADRLGNDPGRWRSVTDVDQRWRETWEPHSENVLPGASPIESHLPGAPAAAMIFDGTNGVGPRFFHVGDRIDRNPMTRVPAGDADWDHSVAFEFLIRPDSLTGEQLIFQSGETTAGVSLSLGDADSDGRHDEARFRLVTQDGLALAVTGDIDDYANVTRDLTHVTAVVSDAPGDRYLELYVNGASIGRVDGPVGETDRLIWDRYVRSFEAATLGSAPAGTIGANSGGGDMAFTGGSLRGDIASFRFLNHALSPQQVQQNYAALLTPPATRVTASSGDSSLAASRPASVAADDWTEPGVLNLIHERFDQLDEPLVLDILATANGSAAVDREATPSGPILPAGAEVSSYLAHFDSPTNALVTTALAGSYTFAEPILGVVFTNEAMALTDLLLGVAGAYDLGPQWLPDVGSGAISFSNDLKTVFFNFEMPDAEQLQFRVLTATPTPGDFNGDGAVDTADYTLWKTEFGVVGASLADGNFDGRVDAADFTVWRDAFGAVGGGSAAVPEPAAGLTVATLLALALGRRRSHAA